jgi:hypothetical protein
MKHNAPRKRTANVCLVVMRFATSRCTTAFAWTCFPPRVEATPLSYSRSVTHATVGKPANAIAISSAG